jgi:RNA polymerase sigma factor (sigma-70 family)
LISRDDSFHALYRAHAPSVFRRARKLLGCEADAQDVVSDVFTSLYQRPEQYAGRSAVSTFLYAMTTHVCLNRIRSQKRQKRLHENGHGAISTASQHPAAPDRATQLRELLLRMPESLGQVAVYYYLDELTQAEIAEILGCSRRHVGDLLVRLKDWLQAKERHP